MPVSHDAFVSYSHSVDAARAAALEHGLEKLAKPMLKLRALDVFRDQTSLAASPGLWPVIVEHLTGSAWCLLMASPASAASSWCNKEIVWWLENRSAERLLIVLTEGEIVWDNATNDFDWSRTTALTPSLAGRFPNEPLYVDLRWATAAEALSLSNPRFRDVVVDVAAPLRGMRKDELDSADVRQLRRTRRVVRSGVALIAIAGALAVWQAIVATAQKKEALRQRDEAVAGRLAVEARDARSGKQVDLAMLLATASLRIRPTPQATTVLLSTFGQRRQPIAFLDAGSSVETLAASSDGRLLASGSADGTVNVWDVPSRRRLGGPFDMGAGPIHSVAFSPNSRLLAAGARDGVIGLWDVSYGATALAPLKRHKGDVWTVQFSPDNRLLSSSGADGSLLLWDVQQGTPIADLLGKKESDGSWFEVRAAQFSPDGKVMAWTHPNDGITLWDMAKHRRIGQPLVSADLKNPIRLAFSPDGTMLAVGDASHALVAWQLAERTPYVLRGHENQVFDVAFSADSKVLASAGSFDGKVILWDAAGDGSPIGEPLTAHAKGVSSVVFLGREHQLATGGWDGKVIIWRVNAAGPPLATRVRNANDWISSTSFTADGKLLALGNETGVILWDFARQQQAGEPLKTGELVARVYFSADGSTAVSESGEDTFTVWDVAHRTKIGEPFSLKELAGPTTASSISPDAKTIACGKSDGSITLWDIPSRRPAGQKLEQGEIVLRMVFSPDGRLLATTGESGAIVIWSVRTRKRAGRPLAEHQGRVLSLAFSQDGKLLASGGDVSMILWDVERNVRTGDPIDFGEEPVTSVAFNASKSMVAAGTSNGGITLVDVETRAKLAAPLYAHSLPVERLTFNPADGKTLVSESQDGRAILWDVGLDSWMRRACGIVNRNLSCREWRHYLRSGANLACPSLPTPACGN